MNDELWLMHGEVRVARLSFNDVGQIHSVLEIIESDHVPPGIPLSEQNRMTDSFRRWWTKRSSPASRSRLKETLIRLGMPTPECLMMRSYGFSLSDSYWLSTTGDPSDWYSLNYYQNDFSNDVGDMLFFDNLVEEPVITSPDTSLNGNLKKRWKIIDSERVLLKGGTQPFMQEPFNEVIASKIMGLLGIKHVEYGLTSLNREPFCFCPCFCDISTEFIPAWSILSEYGRSEGQTLYELTSSSFKRIGCTGVEECLDQMIALDFIIANEDRHYGNFGILRDPVTLKVKGFAPMFDCGASLGFKTSTVWINDGYDLTSKPFKITHSDQIRLVHSFEWMDLSRLDSIEDYVFEVFDGPCSVIERNRAEVIAQYLRRRIEKLRGISTGYDGFHDDPRTDLHLSEE